MPEELNPKIWWIQIGRNNMKFDSPVNAVPVGIMHIVDEIRQKKPNAIIAINAILPYKDIINIINWDIIKKLMYTSEHL